MDPIKVDARVIPGTSPTRVVATGYFKSLLHPFESLPYLWSPAEREFLEGTDAEETVTP